MSCFEVEIGGVQQFEQQVFHVLAHIPRFGKGRRITDSERDIQNPGQGACQQRLAGAGRPDQQDVGFLDFDIRALPAERQSFVVVVHGDGQRLFGSLLPHNVLIHLRDDFARCRDLVEQLFRGTAPPFLLLEDRLAEIDALTTNVDVTRPFDQRADVAVALATERAERVLLCGAAASPTAT